MHKYLRAIGFSKIKSYADEWALTDSLISNPSKTVAFKIGEGENLIIRKKYVASGCGVTLIGIERGDEFRLDNYFPFMDTDVVTSKDACEVTKKSFGESLLVSSEDERFGVTTIFHLTNPEQFYIKSLHLDETYPVKAVCLTGLAENARILLPVEKSEQDIEEQKLRSKKRVQLLQEARAGSDEAMEELADEEMDMIGVVGQRIQTEDIYSVIDSFFMPYGVECDQYMLMGEIRLVEKLTNSMTGEEFYKLAVKANDIALTIGVAAADLVGVPETGRRIKCQVWLLGTVEFL